MGENLRTMKRMTLIFTLSTWISVIAPQITVIYYLCTEYMDQACVALGRRRRGAGYDISSITH